MRHPLSALLWSIVALFFQVFVLGNVQLFGYLNPYLYPIIFILWPLSWNRATGLIVAFLMGFTIDFFEHSGGLQASAATLLFMIRPWIVRAVAPRSEMESMPLTLQAMGQPKFLTYTGMSLLIFHLWLFWWEAFDFFELFSILFRSLLSAGVATVLVYTIQLFSLKSE